jgi:hypothetical protein
MKLHEVELTPRGGIHGPCEGKNACDDILKSMAPCELDVSIVHVKDQNPIDMATLRAQMDTLFEYKKTPCAKRGLKMLLGDF